MVLSNKYLEEVLCVICICASSILALWITAAGACFNSKTPVLLSFLFFHGYGSNLYRLSLWVTLRYFRNEGAHGSMFQGCFFLYKVTCLNTFVI
jgi:hypothetical protein